MLCTRHHVCEGVALLQVLAILHTPTAALRLFTQTSQILQHRQSRSCDCVRPQRPQAIVCPRQCKSNSAGCLTLHSCVYARVDRFESEKQHTSYHWRPSSPPPLTCAIAYTKPLSMRLSWFRLKPGSLEISYAPYLQQPECIANVYLRSKSIQTS